jgi:hypothetical protein
MPGEHHAVSQRSLHNAPIFRLLLKVAVNGTHQCDFLNFCGDLGSQQSLPSLMLAEIYTGSCLHRGCSVQCMIDGTIEYIYN